MEKKPIIIGSIDTAIARSNTAKLFDTLQNNGIESKIVHYNGRKNLLKGQLRAGEIDVIVLPLNELSLAKPKDLFIAMTSERYNPCDVLIVNKSLYSLDQPLKIKPNTVVGTSSKIRASQLKDLSSIVKIKHLNCDLENRIDFLRKNDIGALIVSKMMLDAINFDLTDFETIDLHPREFVPAPGQGVLAYITKEDDIQVRKLLTNVGDRNVAYCTNVERKVLQLFGNVDQVGAYCEQDQIGNYHVWVAYCSESGLLKGKLSQSTYVGLAESVYKKINDQIQ